MEKTRIIVFTDWYLPGFKAGGPIRSVSNLISTLSNNLKFSVITSDKDYHSSAPYEGVLSDKWVLGSFGEQVIYLSDGKKSLKRIFKLLKETPFDVVYLNSMFSLWFTIIPLLVLKIFFPAKQVVLAPRGMLAQGAMSVKHRKKSYFLKILKLLGLHKNVIFHASSKDEEQDIARFFKNRIVVAPNVPILPDWAAATEKFRNKLKLFSVARVSPEKNLLFGLEVLTTVTAEVEFNIYGTVNNSSYWALCQKVISNMPKNITVAYHGEVSHDQLSSKVFNNHHALFLPTLGENFGHIIFESFGAGCPVIISDQTIWKGLSEKKAGFDLPLEQPKLFKSAIELLAELDQEEFEKWRVGARNCAEAYATNNNIMEQNLRLFLNA